MINQRDPGDPIPPELIIQYRKQHHLSQDELARTLGLAGKAVVSAWETGRTKCEGPAAEFLLHLYGRGSAAVAVPALMRAVDEVWGRTKAPLTSWRQISAVPDRTLELSPTRFVSLFPEASLPLGQVQHGFPFTGQDLPGNVCGVSPSGWLGSIPAEPERQPAYLWLLTREGKFAYRERLWEEDPSSQTRGHFEIGSLLLVSVQTTFFLKRFAEREGVDRSPGVTLQLDLNGSRGKGVTRADDYGPVVHRLWSEDHASASIITDLSKICSSPLDEALRLVGELTMQVSPDLVDPTILKRLLKDRKKQSRQLGFLDDSFLT